MSTLSATPRVSIGLPVYNGERYLARTLDDLLGQTFDDFEIVVSDNASTDATAEILADYARRDPRLVVSRNATNLGALANANRVTALARAPLFALAAYDDRHAPDFLAHLVAAMDAAPDAVLAYGAGTLIGEDDLPFQFHPDRESWTDHAGRWFDYDRRLERPMSGTALARFRAVLRSNDVNAPIHGLFRTSVLHHVGGHHLHGSDRLIVAHAALLGPFAYVEAPLFGYRIHAASTFHLTREAWLARESGHAAAASPLDTARTLARYLAATRRAGLSRRQQWAAAGCVVRYALRGDALRRLLLPSPDNYLGWTHWPWADAPRPPTPLPAAHREYAAGAWSWLRPPPIRRAEDPVDASCAS